MSGNYSATATTEITEKKFTAKTRRIFDKINRIWIDFGYPVHLVNPVLIFSLHFAP